MTGVLAALALGLVLAAESVAGSPIVVDNVPYRVNIISMSFADCQDAGAHLSGKEIARTHVGYRFTAVVDPANRNLRLLAASVDPNQTFVDLPDISWPNMTASDREAVDRLIAEITVHERGHIAVGVSSAAEVTQLQHVIVPGSDVPAETAIAHTLELRQQEYDAETSHGVHQSRAPLELAGDDVTADRMESASLWEEGAA